MNDIFSAMMAYATSPVTENWTIFKSYVTPKLAMAPHSRNKTPLLHFAISLENVSILQHLIESNLDLTIQDSCKKNIFHRVALSGNTTIAQLLYEHYPVSLQISLNQQDNSGNTPLHIAAMEGYTILTQLFLKWGADRAIKNTSHETPHTMAIFFNYNQTAKLLNTKTLIGNDTKSKNISFAHKPI